MNETAYTAAKEKLAYYKIAQPGYLKISGADRVDFIQRQTTNDVATLSENNTVTTVLTDPAARILDVLQVFTLDEDTLGIITLPTQGAQTAAFLKGKIFFMDKVTLEDHSENSTLYELWGSDTDSFEIDSALATRIKSDLGTFLLATNTQADPMLEHLAAQGVPELDESTREILRIEVARPAFPNELNDNYTPLQTGLRATISETKGCYTGQEVIARQINYDKITKQLVQLKLDASVTTGNTVRADGKKIGEITSATHSPDHGPLALAVLKRPHFAPGTEIDVEGVKGIVS